LPDIYLCPASMAAGMTSILASSPAAPGLGTLPVEGLALAAGADSGEAGDAISIRELVRMEGSDAAVALYRMGYAAAGC
jgi:hypothetical protein